MDLFRSMAEQTAASAAAYELKENGNLMRETYRKREKREDTQAVNDERRKQQLHELEMWESIHDKLEDKTTKTAMEKDIILKGKTFKFSM